MSGLESQFNDPVELSLGGEAVSVKKASIEDLMRLAFTLDRIKGALGMSRKDFEGMKFNSETITIMLGKVQKIVVDSAVCTIVNEGQDDEQIEVKMTGPGEIVSREVARLFKVSPRAFYRATPDEAFKVGMAFYEVNGDGPLGTKIRDTIEKWTPILTSMKDLVFVTLRQEVTRARLAGGMEIGGMTESSSPYFESSDGPITTSGENSPPVESSQSPDPSPTSTSTEQPQSEPLTPDGGADQGQPAAAE